MKNPEEYEDLNDALRELLAKGLISMEWDPDSEDFVFFMSEAQNAIYDSDPESAGYDWESDGEEWKR